MSAIDSTLVFCAVVRPGTFWSVGPHWRSALANVTGRALEVHHTLHPFRTNFVSDSMDMLREAAGLLSGHGVRFCRSNSPAKALRRLAPKKTEGTLMVVNPFFCFIEPGALLTALRRQGEAQQIHATVRRPDPHPLHFCHERRIPQGRGKYVCAIHTNQWYNYSLYFSHKGKNFEFRRQNYPTVHEACSAMTVFPYSLVNSWERSLRSGRFRALRLEEPASLDASYERDFFLAQVLLEGRREGTAA
ncbi:MAG: hypothetical protein HYT87_00845 [Nitrospirae bacterium]|nr:hypothetical protein [Nitrospirota bacterium]